MTKPVIQIHETRSKRAKNYFKMNYKSILAAIIIFSIFFVANNIANPIKTGFGPWEPRNDDINSFGLRNAGAYLGIEFWARVPEQDGYLDILITCKIPLTVESIINMPSESDGVGSGFNLWNSMEGLLVEQGSFLSNLYTPGQIVANNMSNMFFIDNYVSGSKMTPAINRPNIALDTNWHYQRRYTCTVPSPMQFADMICDRSGITFLNMTNAVTQIITGVGGTCPEYTTQNYGVPCEIDNDTSDYIINLVPSSEADKAKAKALESSLQYSGVKSDTHSYTVLMTDPETDAITDSLFLGTFLISGIIPSAYSAISYAGFKGSTLIDIAKNFLESETDGVHIQQGLEVIGLFFSAAFAAGVNSVNTDYYFQQGFIQGKELGWQLALQEEKAMFQLWLAQNKESLNLSDWQYEQLDNGFTTINTGLAVNHSNLYNITGWTPPYSNPMPYFLPSTINMVDTFTVTIVVGIAIITFVVIVIVWRWRKSKVPKEADIKEIPKKTVKTLAKK